MLRRIGDVILTTPAVRALKKLYPLAAIDFLVEEPSDQILRGNPDISEILVYEKGILNYLRWLFTVRNRGYDWVIDYMGNPRTAILTFLSGAPVSAGPGHVSHRWAYAQHLKESDSSFYSAQEKIRVLRSLGLSPDEKDCIPVLSSDASSEEHADDLLRKMRLPPGPIVGLVPASRKTTRRWPWESYAEVGKKLRDEFGAKILVFYGPGEFELAKKVRDAVGANAYLAPRSNDLRVLAALVGRCSLLVTNCNGPKHIGGARGVATVTIHGSSDPNCWNPPENPKHPIVRLESLECIGCMKNRCPYNLECMRDLTPEMALAPARLLLKRNEVIDAGTGADL